MRLRLAIVAILAVGLAAVGAVLTRASGQPPQLVLDQSVATDFGEVATEAWDAFVDSFPGLEDCIGTVTLVADYGLDELARYDPKTRTMAVRVPAPRVLLDRALVHELAHHVEFACDSHRILRPDFLAALSLEVETPWFEGPEWGAIPSEVCAEAIVEYVLDERGRIHASMGLIDQGAVDVVVRWAQTL